VPDPCYSRTHAPYHMHTIDNTQEQLLYTATQPNTVAPSANTLEIYDYMLQQGAHVDTANATRHTTRRMKNMTSSTKTEIHSVFYYLNGRAPPRICRSTASRSPVLTRGGICVLKTVTYLPYRVSGSTLTAVGRSQFPARWPGTLSRILSRIQRAAYTVLGVYLKTYLCAIQINPRTHSLTQRRAEPQSLATCKENFSKFVGVVFEIREQTERHTDTLIAILRTQGRPRCDTVIPCTTCVASHNDTDGMQTIVVTLLFPGS